MTPLSPRGPALHLRGLSLQLGGTQILEALDWQVAPGQVHALVGPNGCGKSSLLKFGWPAKMMPTFPPPSGGR